MNKIIFKNYFENIDPKEVKTLLAKDNKVMFNYGLCVKATIEKYGKNTRKYRMKVSAIQNQFIDHYLEKMFINIQVEKGKLCEALLKYHKDENDKKYNFKKHFPKHYYQMFYYFTKKGANRFPSNTAKDFYLKTNKEPYSFSLTEENKILINNIKCLT